MYKIYNSHGQPLCRDHKDWCVNNKNHGAKFQSARDATEFVQQNFKPEEINNPHPQIYIFNSKTSDCRVIQFCEICEEQLKFAPGLEIWCPSEGHYHE